MRLLVRLPGIKQRRGWAVFRSTEKNWPLHKKGQSFRAGFFIGLRLRANRHLIRYPILQKKRKMAALIDNRGCLFNLLGGLSNIGTVSAKAHASLSASPSDKNAMLRAHAVQNIIGVDFYHRSIVWHDLRRKIARVKTSIILDCTHLFWAIFNNYHWLRCKNWYDNGVCVL